MKYISPIIFILFYCVGAVFAQTTYYSRNAGSGGDWDQSNSWTFSSDGSGGAAGVPSRTDHVIILAGHTITINNTNDNGSAAVSANGLNRSNVGAFTNSGSVNFYQTGNITVNSSGSLVSNVRVMIEGTSMIQGTFTSTGDVINLGNLTVASGATFTLDDDLIISGTSRTQMDNTSNSNDDIYIDHTYARLCGSGVMNVGVISPNTPVIQYFNSATIAQICSGFQVTCGPDAGCSGFPISGTGTFTFDLTDYNFYKFITINSSQVPGDLTNFPVLVSFSSPDIRTTSDGGGVDNANGFDIVFSSSQYCGELNTLDFEMESYSSNVTTGTIVAWVNVPNVSSSTNTDIYMYYGNTNQSVDLSTPAVYDQNYVSVYHLQDDANDASIYGNDGTNNGSADQASAKIAKGQTFSPGDYIQIPTTDISTSAGTFSAWCYSTSFSTNHQYILGHTTVPAFNNRLQLYTNDNGGNLDLGLGNSHSRNTNIYNFNTSEWYLVVLTWDGSNHEVFVNGQSQVSSTYSLFSSLHSFMDLGNDGLATNRGEAWIGDLDETRFSNIVRSDNWIETEFNNQDDPASFFTPGGELTNSCIPLPIELLSFTAQAQLNTVLLNWTTVSEINNNYFTIDRSNNLQQWEEVRQIEGAGNSRQKLNYHMVDDDPYSGTSYYRLSQTDFDGKYKIEGMLAVNISTQSKNIVFPNPSKGTFTLQSDDIIDVNSIVLIELSGKQVVIEIAIVKNGFEIKTKDLAKGSYLLSYIQDNNQENQLIVIQ